MSKSLLILTLSFLAGVLFMNPEITQAGELGVGKKAPLFKTQTHEGVAFDMASRKGSWTVLYFYPKAGTPGCTKQACAFRDSIDKIRSQGAEVYGVSSDTVAAQAAFHKEHALNFTLLADANSQIIKLYGTKMPLLNMSKRWTFIVDPELNIRWVEKDVDPALDAQKVATEIERLKKK